MVLGGSIHRSISAVLEAHGLHIEYTIEVFEIQIPRKVALFLQRIHDILLNT